MGAQRRLAMTVVKRRPAAATLVKSTIAKRPAAKVPIAAVPVDGSPMKPKDIAALIAQSTPHSAKLKRSPGGGLRVLSWNVDGLQAVLRRDPDAIRRLIRSERADVLFLQETKLQENGVPLAQLCVPDGWESEWSCSTETLGYSGVAVLFKSSLKGHATKGMGNAKIDVEGRVISLELPKFHLVGCYVPNAGEGLKRLSFRLDFEKAMANYLQGLQRRKPVVYCGDLNVCHRELDLWGNHSSNSKGAGYSPKEREAMTKLQAANNLVDSFRHCHPNVRVFTYWSHRFNQRAKNQGWRLDYFLLSASLIPKLHDSFMLTDVRGSDHCPVGCEVACS